MISFQSLRRHLLRPGRWAMVSLLIALLAACTTLPVPPVAPAAVAPEAAAENAEPVELVVFAAASLTDAFSEVAAAFEAQNPGVTVVTNYGGSSGLATQLLEGGVADLFASANNAQMQRVKDAGMIGDDAQIFATNRLVVIVPVDNPGGVETLADLAKPGLKLILAVGGVPIRDYTDQMIAALAAAPSYGAGYAESVYANLISEEENVRQVVAKVALGEADAGVIYTSDVTPDVAPNLSQIEVPDAYNVIATYPIARLTEAPHPEMAATFLDFVLGAEGQAILGRWGFGSTRQ